MTAWSSVSRRKGVALTVDVLTIRDPKTGALIAEEQIQPKEDRDSALARIYRKRPSVPTRLN